VSDAVFTERLRTGLGLLFGTGNVAVAGNRADGFSLTLVGTLSGQSVTGLTMTPPADPADKADWGQVRVESPGTAGTQTGYYLLLDPLGSSITGAKFRLTVGTQTTVDIRYQADKNRQKVMIREALEALSGVGFGGVSVAFDNSTGGVSEQGYRITFRNGVNPSSVQVTPFTTALNGQLRPGVVLVNATLTPLSEGRAATGTVQLVDLYDDHLNARLHRPGRRAACLPRR
jgi:hypothetical protein